MELINTNEELESAWEAQQSWEESMRDIWFQDSLKKYNCYLQVAARPLLLMSKIFKVLNCLCDISINNVEI